LTGLVVDASLTAAWCFEDEETKYARDVLSRAENISFFVPAIWPVEMVNVLLVNERRKRITPTDTARAVTLFSELSIQVDRPASLQPFDGTLLLARAHNLTSYDAS
jgi:predicted nucleic acid-binding protein